MDPRMHGLGRQAKSLSKTLGKANSPDPETNRRIVALRLSMIAFSKMIPLEDRVERLLGRSVRQTDLEAAPVGSSPRIVRMLRRLADLHAHICPEQASAPDPESSDIIPEPIND